jgi:hypothetical protein
MFLCFRDYYPQNIMHDRRVFRGSTYAANIIPPGYQDAQIFQNKKEQARAKAQARAAAAEEFFTRDVRTPEPLQGRQNIDVQTDQFVEELTDKAPCYEIGCQTDIKIHRPGMEWQLPKKRGVDKKTLVEDNELFLFDDEVEPILSVLCGKTLEQARMEVLEEEEIREMREQQHHFKRIQNAENTDISRMEQTEKKKLEDFNKLKANMREKKKNRLLAHKKLVTRVVAKSYLSGLRDNTYTHLANVGFFTNNFRINVLDQDVVPWLYDKVFEFVQDLEVQDQIQTALVADHLQTEQKTYLEAVSEENKRKEIAREKQQKQLAIKEAEKKKKREAREAKKRAEERAKLKTEIEAEFIRRGVTVDGVSNVELVEIEGMQGRNTVGVLGGVLGQLIISLALMERNFNRQPTSKSTKSKKSQKSAKPQKKDGKEEAKEKDDEQKREEELK